MTTRAVSLAEGSLEREMKLTALEKRSTTVTITVLPLDGGRPVTKFRAICDQVQEEIGRGCNRPADGRSEDRQTEQAPTNQRMSSAIAGHQNRWRMAASNRLTPWVARESGRKTPLENGGADRVRNKKQTRPDFSQSLFDASFDSRSDHPHYTALRQNDNDKQCEKWGFCQKTSSVERNS